MTKKTTAKPEPEVAAAQRILKKPIKPTPKDDLRSRAERWAELHASPKKRPEMDGLLDGLTEAQQRCVYLNGQRIRAGLPFKQL